MADLVEDRLTKREYEQCIFKGCDFSNADLSDIRFFECEFIGCNLSLANLTKTTLSDVTFRDCKMLGLFFANCNEFGFTVGFDGCTLNHSSFYQRKMKKSLFNNSHFHEVDFTGCDLTASVFKHCDFLHAKFEHTILEKADFRTSFNYSIDPELNRIKKAKFSRAEVVGLLDKYDIIIE